MIAPNVDVHIGRLVLRVDELPRTAISAPSMADAIRNAMQDALVQPDHPPGGLAQVIAKGVMTHPAVAGQLPPTNGRPRP